MPTPDLTSYAAEHLHRALVHLTHKFPGFNPLAMEGYGHFRDEFIAHLHAEGPDLAMVFAEDYCHMPVLSSCEDVTEEAIDAALDIWKRHMTAREAA